MGADGIITITKLSSVRKQRAWRETARVKDEMEMETEQNRETGASRGLSS